MTLVAAFKILLYGYTSQEDLRVATLIANRNRRETEDVIGLSVNTVILRTDQGGNPTCRQVRQRVRATTLAAYAHQDLPFEELVQVLERQRGVRRSSLCQVMFILQNAMLRPLQRHARTLSFLDTDLSWLMPPTVATTFDVILLVREWPQGLTVSAIYKRDFFEAETVDRMLGDFQQVLELCSNSQSNPSRPSAPWGDGEVETRAFRSTNASNTQHCVTLQTLTGMYSIVVGANRSMRLGRNATMSLRHQLFSLEEHKSLDPKELEILRTAITNAIHTNEEIRAVLRRRVRGMYDQLKGGTRPAPTTQCRRRTK
jgi:non-ribosomal peptide synthetase component F